jgi:hypothetical protein
LENCKAYFAKRLKYKDLIARNKHVAMSEQFFDSEYLLKKGNFNEKNVKKTLSTYSSLANGIARFRSEKVGQFT